MDRRIVYAGAIPVDLDWLEPQRNTELALGYLMQAAFGTSTVIDGLVVTQQTSPNMTVQVGTGSIITYTTVDPAGVAYGALALDTSNLVKIGVNTTAVNMSALTAPAVSGQSQNWLLEGKFLEADGSPVVLPYYNASNPSLPYTGPSNNGTSQNTRRTNTVQLQWKGGTAATTGTQATPSPDSGWVGIAVVTVANGQSTITNSNIVPYVATPVVPTKLPNQRQKLTANLTLYVSPTGSDSKSGLASWDAFATLQKAWNYIIQSLDLNGFFVTVSVANGTYTTGVVCAGAPTGAIGGVRNGPTSAGWPAGPAVSFVGNTTTPSSCLISVTNGNCFSAADGAQVSVQGFKLQATGTLVDYSQVGTGLYAFSSAGIQFGFCDFGACTVHIASTVGSIIESFAQPYTISGGATNHIAVFDCSYVTLSGSAITLTGTPAFSAFASATGNGVLNVNSASTTFSGSATGLRYTVGFGGQIQTAGTATFLPGSVNGTSPGTAGGYYT